MIWAMAISPMRITRCHGGRTLRKLLRGVALLALICAAALGPKAVAADQLFSSDVPVRHHPDNGNDNLDLFGNDNNFQGSAVVVVTQQSQAQAQSQSQRVTVRVQTSTGQSVIVLK